MSAETMFPSNLSWDEFLALPQETRNAALIDGEVVVNPPNAQHEVVVRNLSVLFTTWTRAGTKRGEASTQQPVGISDHRGYQPDFAWYPEEQCSPPDEPAAFTGLPKLIVEVLSPSTRSFDLVRKRADYDRIGICELWLVDPVKQMVVVCRRAASTAGFTDFEIGADETLTSPLFDGLVVEVADLFRR